MVRVKEIVSLGRDALIKHSAEGRHPPRVPGKLAHLDRILLYGHYLVHQVRAAGLRLSRRPAGGIAVCQF